MALLDQSGDRDKMIQSLRAREEMLARTPVALRAAASRPSAASAVRMVGAEGGLQQVFEAAPQNLPQAQRVDRDGFWNWRPAGVAMNNRDWAMAGAEFDLARREAAEAAERSFGASARLSVNRVQGVEDDLGLGDFRRYPGLGLVVLQAGAWQLLVPNRQARFQGTVQTRLDGFRSEGPGFIYEMSFDRGEFAPGTSFIRMAAEMPVAVVGPNGESISDNTFAAPRGAEYNVSTHELRLK
jgi:hypothetical protein